MRLHKNGAAVQNLFYTTRADETNTDNTTAPELFIGKGLGRLPAKDSRDLNHRMAVHAPRRVALDTKFWTPGPVLDQGDTSECVAFSWSQFLQSSPVRSKLPPGRRFMDDLYQMAQKEDEWPGEDYDGTSVRAGAKVLTNIHRISEYAWAETMLDIRNYVLTRGPVVMGTDWYEEMFYPERHGGRLVLEGTVAGGHAWLINGYSKARRAFRMINSWGKSWGRNGMAWISEVAVEQLLSQQGEAAAAIEVAVK